MTQNLREEREKEFGSLLFQIMDVIEDFKDGNGNDGIYLEACNAMKKLHDLKRTILETPVMAHFQMVLGRVQLPPRKRSVSEMEEKVRMGYVRCEICGHLFADKRCLKRHQSRNICRHIRVEKESHKFSSFRLDKEFLHKMEVIHFNARFRHQRTTDNWEYVYYRTVPRMVADSILRSGWITWDMWCGRIAHKKIEGCGQTFWSTRPPLVQTIDYRWARPFIAFVMPSDFRFTV